jgi:hypothetical protein
MADIDPKAPAPAPDPAPAPGPKADMGELAKDECVLLESLRLDRVADENASLQRARRRTEEESLDLR